MIEKIREETDEFIFQSSSEFKIKIKEKGEQELELFQSSSEFKN